jgi:L-fucose isomerase-like protein
MLSDKARKILIIGLANKQSGTEIADAIDASGNIKAANVAEIAVPATATAEDCANKINEIIQALIAAGLME